MSLLLPFDALLHPNPQLAFLYGAIALYFLQKSWKEACFVIVDTFSLWAIRKAREDEYFMRSILWGLGKDKKTIKRIVGTMLYPDVSPLPETRKDLVHEVIWPEMVRLGLIEQDIVELIRHRSDGENTSNKAAD